MVRVKICCIGSIAEALVAIAHGAAVLGLVSRMPSGAGVIDDRVIGDVIRAAPPSVATFLLTSEIDACPIDRSGDSAAPSALQLVDALLLDSGNPGADVKKNSAAPAVFTTCG